MDDIEKRTGVKFVGFAGSYRARHGVFVVKTDGEPLRLEHVCVVLVGSVRERERDIDHDDLTHI